MSFFGYPPYVPVSKRREKAAKKIAKLNKQGKKINPITIEGRNIAHSFWGKAWCDNIDTYQDYNNRLPRGRSYVRNGAVIDLNIKKGCVDALVSGSSLYTVKISISKIATDLWQALIKKCTGHIDSVIELLQGKFSKSVMAFMVGKQKGLFPQTNEITLSCSCPDSASMCKHVAAVLYGVGNRLDGKPELLFLLRQVDHLDLITSASSSEKFMPAVKQANVALDESELSALFGIDIAQNKKKAIDAKIEKKSVAIKETFRKKTKRTAKKSKRRLKQSIQKSIKTTSKKRVVKKKI
jgi:uncharacterized Zn finger protein